MSAVLFGLSMDYEVLLAARMRETGWPSPVIHQLLRAGARPATTVESRTAQTDLSTALAKQELPSLPICQSKRNRGLSGHRSIDRMTTNHCKLRRPAPIVI